MYFIDIFAHLIIQTICLNNNYIKFYSKIKKYTQHIDDFKHLE